MSGPRTKVLVHGRIRFVPAGVKKALDAYKALYRYEHSSSRRVQRGKGGKYYRHLDSNTGKLSNSEFEIYKWLRDAWLDTRRGID